jgi:ElaB/YqjD/DUF883 family membrane-anchored ribosome-binding protein
MSQASVDVTKEKLLQEFTAVVSETEQLIKSVAGASGEKADALRVGVEQRLASAGERLAKIRADSVEQASAAAKATDEYVQGNPWRAIGIAALIAGAAGIVAGLLIQRR